LPQNTTIESLEEEILAATQELVRLRTMHRKLHRPVREDIDDFISLVQRERLRLDFRPNFGERGDDVLEVRDEDHHRLYYGTATWTGMDYKSTGFEYDDCEPTNRAWDEIEATEQGSQVHAMVREALARIPHSLDELHGRPLGDQRDEDL